MKDGDENILIIDLIEKNEEKLQNGTYGSEYNDNGDDDGDDDGDDYADDESTVYYEENESDDYE